MARGRDARSRSHELLRRETGRSRRTEEQKQASRRRASSVKKAGHVLGAAKQERRRRSTSWQEGARHPGFLVRTANAPAERTMKQAARRAAHFWVEQQGTPASWQEDSLKPTSPDPETRAGKKYTASREEKQHVPRRKASFARPSHGNPTDVVPGFLEESECRPAKAPPRAARRPRHGT